jgi:hypothetical protein
MRIRFSPEALRVIREKRMWWREHRDKAPRLFVEELAAGVAKLRAGTDKTAASTRCRVDGSSGAS